MSSPATEGYADVVAARAEPASEARVKKAISNQTKVDHHHIDRSVDREGEHRHRCGDCAGRLGDRYGSAWRSPAAVAVAAAGVGTSGSGRRVRRRSAPRTARRRGSLKPVLRRRASRCHLSGVLGAWIGNARPDGENLTAVKVKVTSADNDCHQSMLE